MEQSLYETEEISIKNVPITSCRTCMGNIESSYNLCASEHKHLLEVLNNLLGFEVKLVNEAYIICRRCELTLNQLEHFKATCLKSQNHFCGAENTKEEVLCENNIRTYFETALSSENELMIKPYSECSDSPKKRLKKSAKRKREFPSKKSKKSVLPKSKKRKKRKHFVPKQFPVCEVLQSNKTFEKDEEEEERQKLGNFEENFEDFDEFGKNENGLKEEIITLRRATLDVDNFDENNEENQQDKDNSQSNSDDSDSKPLIHRIKQNRRYNKRRKKHPVCYKDSFSDDEDETDIIDNDTNADDPDYENADDPDYEDIDDADYEEIITINNGEKTRTKCRLKQFDHEEVLQAINDTLKPFKMNRECILCGFVASHGRALSVHMTLLHKEKKDKWCSNCNCIVQNLQQHLENHKNDLLKCTFCGRSFNKFFHLKEHLKSHSKSTGLHASDTDPKWHSCQICPNSYPDEEKLKEHECKGPDPNFNGKTKKKIKNPRFCALCNKRVRSLAIHIKHKHTADGDLIEPSNKLCSFCGKTFADNSKLTVHMRTHTGEFPYKCAFCDKRCSTRNHLVVHERTHTGEKPHICYICGKAFAQSSVLGTHMKIHTGRPEQCSVCDQRFCRPAELRLHMRRHTGEKPYLCSKCGLSFHQRSHLVEHIKRHSIDRPFKCSFCGKDFKQISVLRAHENIHTGVKPFKCSQCSYTCRQSYSLSVHMKQHTTDTLSPERPYKCLICCKQFTTHTMLLSHTEQTHAEIVESEKECDRIETSM